MIPGSSVTPPEGSKEAGKEVKKEEAPTNNLAVTFAAQVAKVIAPCSLALLLSCSIALLSFCSLAPCSLDIMIICS